MLEIPWVLAKGQSIGPGAPGLPSSENYRFGRALAGRLWSANALLATCFPLVSELFCQLPQALVKYHVLDRVGDRPSGTVIHLKAALDQVLLDPVVHVP